MLTEFVKKAVAKKDPAIYEPWENALMQAIGSNIDWTDKEYVRPIIEYAQTK